MEADKEEFVVTPLEENEHGTTWGPFSLDGAKQFIRKGGHSVTDGPYLIVLARDVGLPNPRIFNYKV